MEKSDNTIEWLILIALAILVAFNWAKVKALLGISSETSSSTSTTTSSGTGSGTGTTSEYDACMKKNSLLPEGSICTSCEGCGATSTVCEAPFTGVIVNGVCVKATNIKVTNTNGARIYNYYSPWHNHPAVFDPTNSSIAFSVVAPYTQVIKTVNNTFYQTASGWVSGADVTIA